MLFVYKRLRCPICSRQFQRLDKVVLDIINTVIHRECYETTESPLLPVKDEGTFRELVATYEFFWDD
ncbi:hypothetical protein GGR02_002227 [Anoxybacillus voinovskiensis]|uniref:Uncharacterized protein n=1 Tax=Anoxybacteroides voinovskiense TaxID=230470 RepID=A0A840DNC3_9BACL|nr:hypothetical protein [Anoxybacillus voinovskiensis]MBB4074460.1 hypothetical protein [Anoxybacillus voinovskiensis]GGJ79292.1 hypothetical protein GCM10008982_30820 [Anoxybacillus voinovskiensis]